MTTDNPTPKTIFLASLAQGTSVSTSASAAGVHRSTVYDWRNKDAAFAAAWESAEEAGVDVLEDEAKRRACEGWVEPVFHKGELCGEVRKYSDTLLIFLLKGRRPEKYRDNHKIDLNAKVEHSVADILDAARKRAGLE